MNVQPNLAFDERGHAAVRGGLHPILEAKGLVKIYGTRRVVDGVEFEVYPTAVFRSVFRW